MTKKTKIAGTIFASALILAGAAYAIKKANDTFYRNHLNPNDKNYKKDPNSDIDWSKI